MNAMVHPGGSAHDQRSREPKTKTIVDFGGVNLRANRQAIGDNEFRWLENLHPIGAGNLQVTAAPSQSLTAIGGTTPASVWPMNINAVDYDYVVMTNGHIYQVKKTSPYSATQITSGAGPIFGSGQTALATWNSTTVLIIDPVAGYWYWNGSSLIAISNTLATITITDPGVYTNGVGVIGTISGGGGSGATATVYTGIISAAVNAGGTGYTVGDILTLNGTGAFLVLNGNFATVKVTSVSGAGAVTGVSVNNAGEYLNPSVNTAIPTLGGSGSGCTINSNYGVVGYQITTVGSGYTSNPSISFSGGTATRAASGSATTSGALNGNSIATYAGRAWIGSGRSVSFTDVNSYTSFAGAGGAFTIEDETLHGNITGLVAANSFLYITGDDSFDILGDVQVTDGITSFTRQNVTSSVGTTLPQSIFPFYRSLYFANTSGFYALSGSTPQKISDNLDGIFPYIDFTKPVTGGQVMVNNILCPAFMFTFTDVLSPGASGSARPLLAVRSRDKWFFANPGSSALFASPSPISGVASLFAWGSSGGNAVYSKMFDPTSVNSAQTVLLTSRLWDGDAPLYAKQMLRQGVGINWNSQDNSGFVALSISTDNEFASVSSVTLSAGSMPTDSRYTLTVAPALSGGEGKYFGFTITAFIRQIIFQLFAAEYIEGKLF